MAQPEQAAASDVTVPKSLDIASAAEHLSTLPEEIVDGEPADENGRPLEAEDADEGHNDVEAAEEAPTEEIQEDEPEQPAIEPPTSWNAEDTEAFQNLPREAQDVIVRREAEREAGLQQKTTAFAEEKQGFEEQIQQLDGQRQFLEFQLGQLAKQMIPERPDPELLNSDPVTYMAQERAYQDALGQFGAMHQQYQAQVQQRNARAEQERNQWRTEQQAILAKELPEYAGENGETFRKDLRSYAVDFGYAPERLQDADALDLQVLNKARLYDKMVAEAPKQEDALKPLPSVQKPSARVGKKAAQMDRVQAAQQKLSKTGSLEDAADLIGKLGVL